MSIELSQVLIVVIIAAYAVYAFVARNTLSDRIVYLVLASLGVALALNPSLSTRAANLVGIGRGADLLLYIFVLFSLFHYVILASRLKVIDQRITALVRENAIENAMIGAPSGLAPLEVSPAVPGREDDIK